MQTEVKFICESPAEAAALLAQLGTNCASATAEKPKRRGAIKEKDNADNAGQQVGSTLVGVAGLPAADPANVLGLPAAADPMATLLSGTSAAQLPPATTAAPLVVQPAAPAAPTQIDVIQAFTVLGKTPGKSIDAVKAVLAPFQAVTVAHVKPEHFGWALKAIKAAQDAPDLASVPAAVKAALGQ